MKNLDRYTVTSLYLADFLSDPVRHLLLRVSQCDHLTDASALLAGVDEDKYIILLDHQPSDYDSEALSPADLVLSGHTHGGQLIPITYVGKWFGIVDREYGYERREGTDFIVTSGISDWELQFKTGASSEYVIITVEGKT